MHLTDCFAELIASVISFRQTVDKEQPSYEKIRSEFVRLLKLSETHPTNGTFRFEDYNEARYAICAWVDESVMGTSWKEKGKWQAELLQRVYYNSADAGEKFFEKLHHLGAHQKEIREVYYLCLALGFQGKYFMPDDESALEKLKKQQLKVLFQDSPAVPTLSYMEKTKLFPRSYPKETLEMIKPKGLSQQKIFWWSVIGGPALFLFLLFLIYRFTLYSLGENILRAIGQA